jgi:hypothetical protein
MENSAPLTDARKLEIIHGVIDKMVEQLGNATALKPSVGDLIRLLEMETELAGKLAPQKTVIQWIDPYLSETGAEPEEKPPQTA